MAQIDVELLLRIVDAYCVERSFHLSPAERAEVLRIAQGYPCKESSLAAGVCYETVRARRKRIYRKMAVDGASEVISELLRRCLAMLATAEPARTEIPPARTPETSLRAP